MTRRGIILAGGSGTRLYPATTVISKQLLPLYDKPMVYYPLTTLMQAGIREILIISTPDDIPLYQRLLGTGQQWGLELQYAIQPSPDGLAQALIIAEPFLNGHPSALILGDNLFYGETFLTQLQQANAQHTGACVFAYPVDDPERYGVVSFDESGQAQALEEKPKHPQSNYAVTGLYFYDSHAPQYAKQVTPSARGELEITDLNQRYLDNQQLTVKTLDKHDSWLDTGTHESLLEAQLFIKKTEDDKHVKIGSPEVVAFQQGWISTEQLHRLAQPMLKNQYGRYLEKISDNT